jgi:chromosome segregation ATPase|tara:strand:- start:2647 stop:2928 length:282 start_codon:yes stop_codon:yes gene_type:complete
MAKKKQIKFTQKEIDSLQELRQSYANVESSLGKLEIARMQTEQQLEQIENQKLHLETQYVTLQGNESKIVSELTEKYGVGNLDTNTGTFTPAK